MIRRLQLLACLFALAHSMGASVGCGSDAYDPPEEPAPADFALRAVVGPEGGRIEGEVGGPLVGVALEIPAGALSAETEIVLSAAVDGTPLALTAERIGPHVAIEPADLRFAVPARLTVPFDSTLRDAWSTPHEDCRVWLREGEGWARADAVETSPEGVTVEIDAATVAAAGVIVAPIAVNCRLTGTCREFNECLSVSGTSLCLTQLPSPEVVPFETATATVEDGFLWFTHAPGKNQLTIAKHDLLARVSDTELLATLDARPTTSVQPRGRIQLTDSGDVWVGMLGYGNLRFRETSVGRFDASFSQRAAGVVVDHRTQRELVRLRETNDALFGLVGSTSWRIGSLVPGERVFARSSLNEGTAADNYVYLGTSSGSFTFDARRASTPNAGCRGVAVNVDASDESVVTACSDGTLQFRLGERPATFDTGITIGSMALTPDNVLYATDPSRAEIVRVLLITAFTEGALVVEHLPLTGAEPGTREHDRMLPRAIRFDDDLDRLVLVTRGVATDGTPEIYSIDGGV